MAETTGPMLLEAKGVAKRFGALQVLSGVNFTMKAGEAVGIVGPNGAGKTTFLSVLSGAHAASEGRIAFFGKDITTTPAMQRCHMGLVRTHQIPRPFSGMTVFENVHVAAVHNGRRGREAAYQATLEALDLCGMLPIANRQADTIGLLDRKRLELARAVAADPKLLLLDEIGGGLTESEAEELVETIAKLSARGISIIWIEHIVHVLLKIARRLICMDAGRIIADGDPQAVMSHPEVVKAYLGGSPE
jgi:branched-chain amino acid transport system ATP-binding protein